MRYKMSDDTIVDTDKAIQNWVEKTHFNGHDYIGRSSASQWHHQGLYRSSKGRYYLEQSSQVQGEKDHAWLISRKDAAAWLLFNDYELPEDLEEFEKEVIE